MAADVVTIGRGARGAVGGGRGADADVAAGVPAVAEGMGLYVHFPFCSVHCPYCDFAVDARADIPHDAYAAAVIGEIRARAPWFGAVAEGKREGGAPAAPRLVSIYFGGGTPGLWRPESLGRVIDAGRAAFGATGSSLEITVEANPGEVSEAGLAALAVFGVNRLSLGVQSLDDRALAALGRNHVAAAAPAAMRAARAAGFDNVSIDLMFGLPDQTMEDWRRTIDEMLELGPEHVSAYALTIERGTPFGARARKGELVVADDGLVADMQSHAVRALGAAGLERYEVSSYARAGRRAVHNSLYWALAPYLGVGASASSFRALADGTAWRFSNPRATDTYLRAAQSSPSGSPAPAQVERRLSADLENEAVWLALRTTDGLSIAAHTARYGAAPLAARGPTISALVARGWLTRTATHLAPTVEGLLFADEIASRLWQ